MSTITLAPTGAPVMNKKLGFVSMLISATGMGFVGFFGRYATPEILKASGEVIGDFLALGRMSFGVVGFFFIVLLTGKLHLLRTTRVSFAVVAGGVCIGTSLALYVSSTTLTSIANAVFLIYTGPLFSAILAWVFLKERISPRNATFLGLVFVGMILTIGIVNFTAGEGLTFGLDFGGENFRGDMRAIGSGVFYGLALFFYRYRGDMASEVRGFWNFVFAAVACLAIVSVHRPKVSAMTATNWQWAIGMFIVCGFVALGFLVVAGKHLLAVELSCVSYWECLVALPIGLIAFSEPITLVAGIGGLLIIIGGMGPMLVELVMKPKRQADRQQVAAVVPER
jgi:drug/metabolite transporter (DMT)-like permease